MAYGGRVERWAYPLSPLNLVPNASFEVLGVDGKPEGWGWASTARSMTWLAICAGAHGIGYWSLGAKGLAWLSEPFYTQAKEALIRVVDEVKAEESWLIGTRLAGPSVPSGILAIRRQANGVAKVFSVNRTVTIVTDGVRTWDPYGTQFWSE